MARGIHRTIVRFGMLALVVGVCLGWGVQWAHSQGWGLFPLLCTGIPAAWLVMGIGWGATFEIVRPLRRVAEVASELSEGRLDRREALRDEPGEVGEVSAALKELSERLAGQLKDQRALLAAVSHELRSPLGRARIVAEMLRDGADPVVSADRLDCEITGMDGLIADLLAAARIDFEAIALQPLDALDLARRAVEIVGFPVEIVGGPGPIAVSADPTLMARALSGILDNARRYGARRVELRVLSASDGVRFEVADDGPGFADEDLERAFEPFWRGSTAGEAGGTGLGLALVRRIAGAHGGTAGARHREGGGAVVWMEVRSAGARA